MTTMEEAFANAAPANTPPIRLVTRSRSGMRVWFRKGLRGRRFNVTQDGNNLLLDEDPYGRSITHHDMIEMPHDGGDPFRYECNVKPTFAAGRLAYLVENVPLGEASQLTPLTQIRTPKAEIIKLPTLWTEARIMEVLESVRTIEASTKWRLSHDGKTNLAIFIARLG